MTIVDSTVWIDVARGVRTPETRWYQQYSQTERLGLTDLILMEVLQGTSSETEFVRTETLLSKFRVFDSVVHHWPLQPLATIACFVRAALQYVKASTVSLPRFV